jgi:hypothetical protein
MALVSITDSRAQAESFCSPALRLPQQLRQLGDIPGAARSRALHPVHNVHKAGPNV